jgi:hypothetical protein
MLGVIKSLRLSIGRGSSRHTGSAGHPREQDAEWKIQNIRDAISEDWIRLAAKDLKPEERKAVREHLEMNVAALRDLIERNRPTTGRTEEPELTSRDARA